MPELPELEVVREVLERRVVGQTIKKVELLPPGGPIVVRDLTGNGFEATLLDTGIKAVDRRGKFLVFTVQAAEHSVFLVINPKLTGRLQLADPAVKRMAKTHVVFTFDNGSQLRYLDQKKMGQLYLAGNLDSVPDFAGMGPEPFDVSLGEFQNRLKPYRGEIKGVLTRSEFIAGIGNAYADEILWAARLHPYRKRTQMTAEEVGRLHAAMLSTLMDAIEKVRAQMGENIEREPRDFMAIHMKTGETCPRCGTSISMISANQRTTNFCRTCQPGGLIKGME